MAKKKRNITGLRNQPKLAPSHVKHTDLPPRISHLDSSNVQATDTDSDEEEWCPNLQFDSCKPEWDASDTEDDVDSEDEQDFLDSKEGERPGVNVRRYRNDGLYIALMCTAICAGDDPRDEDWVPKKTRKKLRKEKTDSAPPKKCVKGPDVGSKSIRTRCRYKDLLKDQRTLSSLGFTREKTHRKESDQSPMPSIVFEEHGEGSEDMDVDNSLSPEIQIRQESVTPPPLNFNDEVPPASCLGKRKEREAEIADAERDDEEWEAELDESLVPGTADIWDWLTLLIPEFHDKSSFHAFEHTSSIWLHSTEQIMPKISRGRLIHASEFIEPENGRLVMFGKDGEVIKEACQIIYPGSNGDAWWDCEQLIEQVKKKAIPVFEEAHPGCQALFIFDQSSAHTALPPDALKAFEMNKSNGRAQPP
ncbi:hypothetical protein K443DRAFT_10648 [Laccaria amethystina LaAM-08-1]|uniref:DDE-1 domain-containing protein n=1 Tax=Laccaria amethystina LaAM-08-1 TaxID=1095629 RepID=A0A0C9XFH9_9AGAR|nr:hypothetical protein K443DRAFT_10648 [Laccaria amethystina LaAM-08-1]